VHIPFAFRFFCLVLFLWGFVVVCLFVFDKILCCDPSTSISQVAGIISGYHQAWPYFVSFVLYAFRVVTFLLNAALSVSHMVVTVASLPLGNMLQ
jgi:hypothetical protein